MKWSGRVLLLLAMVATPAYVLCDERGLLPPSLRDRPWPFFVAALLCVGLALRLDPAHRIGKLLIVPAVLALLATTAHRRYRLPPSSPSVKLDAPLPAVSLVDEAGAAIDVAALRGAPLLLVWFRGSWCPYCRRQLEEITAELARYDGRRFRMLAIAPDPPEPLAKLRAQRQLPFSLISDPDRRLFNACELAHCVALVDDSGIVRWAVVSGNWERELPARALLQAAYRMQ